MTGSVSVGNIRLGPVSTGASGGIRMDTRSRSEDTTEGAEPSNMPQTGSEYTGEVVTMSDVLRILTLQADKQREEDEERWATQQAESEKKCEWRWETMLETVMCGRGTGRIEELDSISSSVRQVKAPRFREMRKMNTCRTTSMFFYLRAM